MQRVLALVTGALLVSGSVGLVIGCGDDDGRKRIRRSIPRARVQQEQRPLTPEEIAERDAQRARMAQDVWMWPEGAGPAPDVIADSKACEEKAEAMPSVKYANPLVKLTWLAKCMEGKGWVKNPESKVLGSIR